MAGGTEFSESACVVCGLVDSASEGDRLALVGEKGKKTLADASICRKDSKLTQYLFSNPGVLRVHGACRILYNTGKPCPQLKRKCGSDGEEGAHSESQPKMLRS
jgi:hypothetical protein